MITSKYVVVQMSGNDLYANSFDDYDAALAYVNETEEKAYIIRFEDYCADHYPSVKLTLEPHT